MSRRYECIAGNILVYFSHTRNQASMYVSDGIGRHKVATFTDIHAANEFAHILDVMLWQSANGLLENPHIELLRDIVPNEVKVYKEKNGGDTQHD